jgi:hypothetical protein
MSTNQGIDQSQTSTLFSQERGTVTTRSHFAVPPGYHRAIRFGANWTMIISPYRILFLIVILAIGGTAIDWEDIRQVLEIAGTSPVTFAAPLLLAGLFHVLFSSPW